MTTTTSTQPTLVTGGTGKTGSRVATRLQALGVPVRVGSRAGDPPFDWAEPATWDAALAGTSAAYVSFFPDLAVPGAPEAIAAFAARALAAGTERLVLLSGRGEEEALRAEHALRDSGATWTILRCSWFMQNFSEGEFLEPVQARRLALPVDGVLEPFVDADDIADVAAAALTRDGHAGRLYELTGPRLMTFAQAAAEIGEAIGEPVAFASVAVADHAAGLRDAGLPEDVIALVTYLFTDVLDGRNASLTDGVREALGRPARDFAAYARAAAGDGSWAAG